MVEDTFLAIRAQSPGAVPITKALQTEAAGAFKPMQALKFEGEYPFAKYNFEGWAVLEWECCLKHPEDGAAEGVDFINHHIIRTTDKAFDDFAGGGADEAANRRILGLA